MTVLPHKRNFENMVSWLVSKNQNKFIADLERSNLLKMPKCEILNSWIINKTIIRQKIN